MLPDLRRIRRRELSRLRALSVDVAEMPAASSRAALARFAAEFVGPDRAAEFLAKMDLWQLTRSEIDYGRWLRPDARPREASASLAWLSGGRLRSICIRFDRWAGFPAVRLSVDRMLDEWALSWPGVYVSFDARRALSVSIDYEVACCDLSALGASPYR